MTSEQSHSSPAETERDETASPVIICLLGNFRLLVAGEVMPVGARAKSEELLSLLALQAERRVPREQLLQAVWPESDPALARTSLRVLVHQLHRLLGPALHGDTPVQHERGYYRLNLGAGIGVDLLTFDRLIEVGNRHLQAGNVRLAVPMYERAAKLYRGDLQVASNVQVIVERERLRARYLTLLAQLAESYFQAGDYSIALRYLWKLLGCDAYREDAYRLIMRCFVRSGERAAALRQYQVCIDMLRAEFDAVPEAATVALYEQIRRNPGAV